MPRHDSKAPPGRPGMPQPVGRRGAGLMPIMVVVLWLAVALVMYLCIQTF